MLSTPMYYFIYGILFVLSLLPWRILYILSDFIYVLGYYIIRYRKKTVIENIKYAFPTKTSAEQKAIAKIFYKNFIDVFFEIIKLISIPKTELQRRAVMNTSLLEELHASGKSVQILTAHFFNWEFLNLAVSSSAPYRCIAVYRHINQKAFNRLIFKLRSKFGTELMPTSIFKAQIQALSNTQILMGIIADQRPVNPMKAHWSLFFGRMAPFVKGPEELAKSMDTAVVLANIYKVKRGFYQIELRLLTDKPRETEQGFITKSLIRFTESCVEQRPDNYLWSHRRWKHTYNAEEHQHLVLK